MKSLTRAIVLLMAAYLACEATSALAYIVLERKLAGFNRLSERRARVLQSANSFIRNPHDPSLANEALHPYAGFVLSSIPGFDAFRKRSAEDRVIVVMGGSVAMGFCVEGASTMLEGFPGRVICLAGRGYKQPQQLTLWAYYLSQGVTADAVINLDGFNELALPKVENIPKNVHPSYPRKWFFRTGSLYDESSLRDVGSLVWLHNLRVRLAEQVNRTPWKYSITASVLWERLDRMLMRRENLIYARFYGDPLKTAGYEQTGPAYHADSDEQMYADFARIWADSSIQLHHLCAANGIRYYHFLQPNQYVAGSKVFTPEELEGAIALDSAYRVAVEKGYPMLLKEGERVAAAGVNFTDLTGLFQNESQTIYKDTCCHMNKAGHEQMGKAVGEVLSKS